MQDADPVPVSACGREHCSSCAKGFEIQQQRGYLAGRCLLFSSWCAPLLSPSAEGAAGGQCHAQPTRPQAEMLRVLETAQLARLRSVFLQEESTAVLCAHVQAPFPACVISVCCG